MKYLIVIEPAGRGYSSYSPDVPGCVSVGATPVKVRERMREALELHFEGMRIENLPLPVPRSTFAYAEVPD